MSFRLCPTCKVSISEYHYKEHVTYHMSRGEATLYPALTAMERIAAQQKRIETLEAELAGMNKNRPRWVDVDKIVNQFGGDELLEGSVLERLTELLRRKDNRIANLGARVSEVAAQEETRFKQLKEFRDEIEDIVDKFVPGISRGLTTIGRLHAAFKHLSDRVAQGRIGAVLEALNITLSGCHLTNKQADEIASFAQSRVRE